MAEATLEQLKAKLEETLQMQPMDIYRTEEKTEEGDSAVAESDKFPSGTTLKLTTKKYLWAVLGASSLDVSVTNMDEVWNHIQSWYEFQDDLIEAYKDELDDIYSRSPDKRSYPKKGGGDAAKALRNRIFELGSEKGIYVMGKWKNIGNMNESDLNKVLAELEAAPAKGEGKGTAVEPDAEVQGRVSRSRRSR